MFQDLVPILIQPESRMQLTALQQIDILRFQSSSSPKAGCNSGDFKPADTNKFNNDFRDPIIPHPFRQIHILDKNSLNLDEQYDREPPRILTITIGSR
jgi:hypothetical protein